MRIAEFCFAQSMTLPAIVSAEYENVALEKRTIGEET
jgi:hypothetical protein